MTAQAADAVFYDEEKVPLFSNPLEAYYGEDNPRPPFLSPSTANWRGYVATWEVADGRLYLTDITAWLPDPGGRVTETGWPEPVTVGMDMLFPDGGGRTFASWYTGRLRIPVGDMLEYEHMGYESVYEKDLFLTVERGKVTGRELVRNRSVLDSLRARAGRALNFARVKRLFSRLRKDGARRNSGIDSVPRTEREPWTKPDYCIFCGSRSREQACKSCGEERPPVGDSATVMICLRCEKGTPTLGSFCQWCGTQFYSAVRLN